MNKPPVPEKVKPPENLKIYSLQKDSGKTTHVEANVSTASKPQKRTYKAESDSDDE